MNKLIAALILSVAFAGSAIAHSCPTHMKAIDEALAKNPPLTAEQLAQVQQLRAEGEKFHSEGLHAESVQALEQAEQILGIAK
jgi:hypothetical protein